MATRPLAFGVRFRHQGRTLAVRAERRGYVVEHSRQSAGAERRLHGSLGEALRDFARIWRGRLH